LNELYRFLTLLLSPEWYRLGPEERAEQKHEFAQALRAAEARTHAYSLVGTRTDADLLLWLVGDDLEDLVRAQRHGCARQRSGLTARGRMATSPRAGSRNISASTRTPETSMIAPPGDRSGTAPT